MNQTYEPNNNVDHIIQYIKNSILWGPSSIDHSDKPFYYDPFFDNPEDEEDERVYYYYKQSRTLELIYNILSNHSTPKK